MRRSKLSTVSFAKNVRMLLQDKNTPVRIHQMLTPIRLHREVSSETLWPSHFVRTQAHSPEGSLPGDPSDRSDESPGALVFRDRPKLGLARRAARLVRTRSLEGPYWPVHAPIMMMSHEVNIII